MFTYTKYDIPYPAAPINIRVAITDTKGNICSLVRLSEI